MADRRGEKSSLRASGQNIGGCLGNKGLLLGRMKVLDPWWRYFHYLEPEGLGHQQLMIFPEEQVQEVGRRARRSLSTAGGRLNSWLVLGLGEGPKLP